MNRRDFLAASATAGTLAGLNAAGASDALAQGSEGVSREIYELRMYAMNPRADQAPLMDYLQKSLIPAHNRLGINKIGVFTEQGQAESPTVYLFIPYPTIDVFFGAARNLAADAEYQKSASAYLALPKLSAPYARIESSLMIAFEGMPKMIMPTNVNKPNRMFELRIYESPTEATGRKKIEMFNKGEIEVMRRVGLGPVFYGETIIGTKMPNLTYLLSGDDGDTHKKHWGDFRTDREWVRMRTIPEYHDALIISRISNKFLVPTHFSQI